MKVLVLILVAVATNYPQAQFAEPIAKTKRFEFHSHFWFNMHHFLQHVAFTTKRTKSRSFADQTLASVNKHDRVILQAAVDYYSKNLADKDLRTSRYMSDFRKWIVTQPKAVVSFKGAPKQFRAHLSKLAAARTAYLVGFWKEHDTRNRNIVRNYLALIRSTETEVSGRLSMLTRRFWQSRPIRVDVVKHAKGVVFNSRERPYTSLGPTHVVMNSSDGADKPTGTWLELLYHESSHHLIFGNSGFVGGTIRDVAESSKQKSLRSLWHAYLFYFSGVVTKDAIAKQGVTDYQIYMKTFNVFSAYYKHLPKNLDPYIKRRKTLADATSGVFKDFAAARKSP